MSAGGRNGNGVTGVAIEDGLLVPELLRRRGVEAEDAYAARLVVEPTAGPANVQFEIGERADVCGGEARQVEADDRPAVLAAAGAHGELGLSAGGRRRPRAACELRPVFANLRICRRRQNKSRLRQ